MYNTCIMHLLICVPVLFADHTGKESIHHSAMQLPYGCVGISTVFCIAAGLIAEMLLILIFICNAVQKTEIGESEA